MKTRVAFTLLVAVSHIWACAATKDPETTLQRGLFEEEANHDLPAAIRAYQSVVSQFDQNRKLAATAVFRLGECYRRQGRTNEAAAQYERVLREFSDQSPLIALSRQNLSAMGVAVAATDTSLSATAARQEQKRLLEEEIKLVEQKLAAQQKQVQVGALSREELIPTQRELLELRRKIAALDAGTPMMLALSEGGTPGPTSKEVEEVKRIQAMIKDSPDLINAPVADKSGATPLHIAAAEGELVVADFLLRNGADPNSRNRQEATPLYEAAANGRKAMVELLLQNKADPALANGSGWTPLYRAAEKSFLGVVQTLLANRANPNAKAKDGSTPLHAAVGAGQTAIIDALLAQKADVNAARTDGLTPLHVAAVHGLESVAQQLLQRGAVLDAKDSLGKTPLVMAVQSLQIPMLKLLLDKKADPNLEFQTEVNNKSLTNPLWESIFLGRPEMSELLLKAGANPNVQIQGRSPLLATVSGRRQDLATLLLRYGADPNTPDFSGASPLHYSVTQPAMLDLLLSTNAAANATNERGETPLYWAAGAGFKPAAELLLTHKADPNLRDKDGLAPLHLAVLRRDKEMVNLLLNNGADPNIRNNTGRTPLDWVKNSPPYQSYTASDGIELPRTMAGLPMTPGMPPPGSGLGRPMFTGRTGQASGISTQEQDRLAAALKSHGAVEELPDFSSIRVTRPGWGQSYTVFESNTNGVNHFTLLEAISFVFDHGLPNPAPVSSVLFGSLSFPNLSRIFIHRRDPKQPARSIDLEVNLLDAASGFDCSKDVPLEFGDVIEIPEREHNLAERAVGLSDGQRASLPRCLMRSIKFVVKGQVKDLNLTGCYLSRALNLPEVQSILLSSCDFSAVRIQRAGPGASDITENVKAIWDEHQLLRNDLWLGSGDVIEVPEKP
jgi:ankyrin repeat protein